MQTHNMNMHHIGTWTLREAPASKLHVWRSRLLRRLVEALCFCLAMKFPEALDIQIPTYDIRLYKTDAMYMVNVRSKNQAAS